MWQAIMLESLQFTRSLRGQLINCLENRLDFSVHSMSVCLSVHLICLLR